MVREKVARNVDKADVQYDGQHWQHLASLREKALEVMRAISIYDPRVYGSVARGDVSNRSDIDILIPCCVSEFQIMTLLEKPEFARSTKREVVQATPLSALKAVVTLEHDLTVLFPLIPFYPREKGFYDFGGSLTTDGVSSNQRVPGVDKRLVLIEPTDKGHTATGVNEHNASLVARSVGVSIDVVNERLRVLKRRDRVGRTGVFLRREVGPHETFGSVLRELESSNPATRRRITRKKA